MAEAMTGRDYYIQHGYDELPESVRKEMRRVFDTGVNNSGVWVRFKEVENLAGIMAYEYVHRPIATNADRFRSMSDEELAKKLSGRAECPDKIHMDNCTEQCEACWLDWLKSPLQEVPDA